MPMISSYNPDVLSCLANLSNDEVFTPPGLANEILDLLPFDLWSNNDAKFLDPVNVREPSIMGAHFVWKFRGFDDRSPRRVNELLHAGLVLTH